MTLAIMIGSCSFSSASPEGCFGKVARSAPQLSVCAFHSLSVHLLGAELFDAEFVRRAYGETISMWQGAFEAVKYESWSKT
jgi:hypothetical protein